ncbi:MAG: hypothetical protein CMO80_20240 [Verrucomicrobiales bacterium]|nr:hypothetical protein [Verrucomicrobiales bacterium]|tara:strand:- start:1432 stop:2589 length:1158 start_codon:yes stop_codon:yes gene_type:complete
MKTTTLKTAAVIFAGALCAHAVSPGEVQKAIAAIKAVGPEGEGNAKASDAWLTLSKGGDDMLIPLLTAMNGASPMAANWLRGAVHTVADKGINSGHGLPTGAIEEWLRDTRNDPRARRLAYDLIKQVQPQRAEWLIKGMLNDPSVELRRDAVRNVLNDAKARSSTKLYQKALDHARDVDQIQTAVAELRKAGKTVDVPKQFGFLMDWQVVGPFDNAEKEGFARKYAPESKVNLKTAYDGKKDKVKWEAFTSEDQYGMVDINTVYGMEKGVTAYAFTEYEAKEARKAELRLGSKNAWKIWVNGKFIFGRDEYHRGMRIDQYRLPIQLQKGKNTILVKLCQDEQEKPWTKEWQFQLRVSDATGAAILAQNRKPTPAAALKPKPRKKR